MVLGAGHPPLSQSTYEGPYYAQGYAQGGHLQVPRTQYSQF
jgi:hypothetical protein